MTATSGLVRIEMLGAFRVTLGGQLLSGLDGTRVRSLLAYLLLHSDRPQRRERIAYLFWPESTEAQARTNLRQLLHHLRRALPDSERFLDARTHTLRWREEAGCRLDVREFEETLERADSAARAGDDAEVESALKEAVTLYRGDLLPGSYDAWIEPRRMGLREAYLGALEKLIRTLESGREYGEAIRYCRRLVQEAPLREEGHRALIRLQASRGDRASALRAYHDCSSLLERELGVEPDTSTRSLYERLIAAEEDGSDGAARSANEPSGNVHEVRGPGPPTPEPDGGPLTGEVPLVGRDREWGLLAETWEWVARGGSRFFAILGEAGTGKTRLAEEMLRWVARQGYAHARARCFEAEGRLAYDPVAEWLRSDTIANGLGGLRQPVLSELARILPDLSHGAPDLPTPEPLTESWRRRRFFEALARAVLGDGGPRALLIDDLQWCDRETLEWLRFLMRFEPTRPLLLLGTARVEGLARGEPVHRLLHELRQSGQLEEIELDPLDRDETKSLAQHLQGRDLSEETAERLFEETEGNPLFIVEMLRAGAADVGSDGAPFPGTNGSRSGARPVPPRVRAVLASRLDQLSPGAGELAALAATIGRDFRLDVLAAASRSDEASLVRPLDELWRRRIIREHGASSYDFSHDKLREVAYDRTPPARRRALHRRVAAALEAVYPEEESAPSSQLATHYQRAGLPAQAIRHFERAAERAQGSFADEEAIKTLARALAITADLPSGACRDRTELSLRMTLGRSLVSSRGWGAPEVGEVYERASSLADGQDDPAATIEVLWGLQGYHLVRGALGEGGAIGRRLLSLGEKGPHPLATVRGAYSVAHHHCLTGDFLGAREAVRTALRGSDAIRDDETTHHLGQPVAILARGVAALVEWHLGHPDRARAVGLEGLALAEERAHPFSQAIAHSHLALLHQVRNEPSATLEHASAAVGLCERHGIAYYLAWARILEGWAVARRGGVGPGLSAMESGLESLSATGTRLRAGYHLALIGDARAREGSVDRGLELLAEALALVNEHGEKWCEAEVLRTEGEILRLDQRDHDAEDRFRLALETARRQNAPGPELRAALSLARLLRDRGRAAEAGETLTSVVEGFTEGFDTPDLRDAGELLAKIARGEARPLTGR